VSGLELVFRGQDQPPEKANRSVADRSEIVSRLVDTSANADAVAVRDLLPAAAYVRVSTEDQAKEGFSLDAQRARIRAYCVAKGYRLLREFADDGFSGRSTKRPGFRSLVSAIRDGLPVDDRRVRIAAVVVARFDRLNRNLFEFLATQREMQRHNVYFASVDETIDTNGPFGRFFVQIIGAFAELESGIIGERVWHGMHQKALAGGFNGMSAPFGYDIVDSGLVVNEREAACVRRIASWRRRGKSLAWIANRLERERVPTKRGGHWSAKQIFRIVHSPILRGDLRWSDVVMKGTHEAILKDRRRRDG